MLMVHGRRYVGWMIGLVLFFLQITVVLDAKQKSFSPSKKLLTVIPTKNELKGLCKEEGTYPGSARALMITSTLTDPAKGGIHQVSYLCNGTPAALYIFDFADAKKVPAQLAFFGGVLWGGPGPNVEHPDEILYQGGIIAVVSSQKPGDLARILLGKKLTRYNTSGVIGFLGGEVTAPEQDLTSEQLGKIRSFIQCDKAPERQLYCQMVDRFTKGKPLGTQPIGLPGVSLRIDLDTSKVPVLWREEASYFVSDSQEADYGTIRPTGEEDETQNVISLIHRAQPILFDHPFAQFARRMMLEANFHTTSQLGQSSVYGYNSKVYMRDVGDGITLIETFPSGRLFYLGWFPKK